MSASQFMDKQILGLTSSPQPPAGAGELFDLMNPQEEQHHRHQINGGGGGGGGSDGGDAKDEIFPSYDFQPIRTVGSSPPTSAPATAWGSLDSKVASSNLKTAGILEPHVLTKVSHEGERSNYSTVTLAEIDRTVKKYADNLLHALEGVGSRLSQLESRTHHLEISVDELKVTVGNYNGSTDGKLRQFENMLHEVQAGVQILRDKQEIVETQLQLAKFQTSKADPQPSENTSTGQADTRPQKILPPQPVIQQQHQAPPPSQPSVLPALPAPNAPPPPPPLQNTAPPQFPGHLPQLQTPSVPSLPREPYFPSSAQPTETTHQQYQAPSVQQPQAPPTHAPAPQHYQPPPQFTQYSQPPPQPATVNPSTPLPPTVPQQPEETVPYAPPTQNYPPNIRPPAPYMQPPSGPPTPFYGLNPGMYESPASRPSSGPPPSFGAGYGPQGGSGFSESYAYSGSPSHRGSSGMKSSPFAPSGASSGGSSNYGRLPTAQMLPQAMPIASSPPSGSSGNRVPLDDVVEKVATMGFSREQVRATVRRLTENGQNVDLNVVLDKLMNDGDVQPQKGWLGR